MNSPERNKNKIKLLASSHHPTSHREVMAVTTKRARAWGHTFQVSSWSHMSKRSGWYKGWEKGSSLEQDCGVPPWAALPQPYPIRMAVLWAGTSVWTVTAWNRTPQEESFSLGEDLTGQRRALYLEQPGNNRLSFSYTNNPQIFWNYNLKVNYSLII